MRRSEVNHAIQVAIGRLRQYSISLPPFAWWRPEEWRNLGPECDRIRANGLGWDVTDFGSGSFPNCGAILFTLRNGNHARPEEGTPYAEKLIIMIPGQALPMHFHHTKTEDIINRGGGVLGIELHNARLDDSVDNESAVEVYCDARKRTVKPGKMFELQAGESITLTPRIYHRFTAVETGGVLICGEVSTVNDDTSDNHFAESIPRFARIEEDEDPIYLLCNEYPGR